jgi:hypothetical protein
MPPRKPSTNHTTDAPSTEPQAQTRTLVDDPIKFLHTDQQGQLLAVGSYGHVYVRTLLAGTAVWSLYMVPPKVNLYA